MTTLQRNQLVWLSTAGWQQVLARAWDAQAQSILGYWHRHQLPLVVCSQRVFENPQTISLGLPAPLQWDRRRLALEVAAADIERTATFPPLTPGLLPPTDTATLLNFLHHIEVLQVPVRVYGSYGWQQLTGLPCVRESSDLDLLIPVPDADTAGQVVWLLQGLQLGCRVDGELLFPEGQAVAWREFAQLISGKVERVLVKHRMGVQLNGMSGLRTLP